MKSALATLTVIISLLGARVAIADAPPAAVAAEQQFQQADVQLAIEQYKKLRMAAFDLELKLQTEPAQPAEQRKQLLGMRAQLQALAAELRAETLKSAEVASANNR